MYGTVHLIKPLVTIGRLCTCTFKDLNFVIVNYDRDSVKLVYTYRYQWRRKGI